MGAGGCHAIGTSIFGSILQSTESGVSVVIVEFLYSTEDSAIEGGGKCNTSVLTPWY